MAYPFSLVQVGTKSTKARDFLFARRENIFNEIERIEHILNAHLLRYLLETGKDKAGKGKGWRK